MHAVQFTGNVVAFALVAVVNIAIMMIVRSAQAEYQAIAADVVSSQLFILQQIHQLIR